MPSKADAIHVENDWIHRGIWVSLDSGVALIVLWQIFSSSHFSKLGCQTRIGIAFNLLDAEHYDYVYVK